MPINVLDYRIAATIKRLFNQIKFKRKFFSSSFSGHSSFSEHVFELPKNPVKAVGQYLYK